VHAPTAFPLKARRVPKHQKPISFREYAHHNVQMKVPDSPQFPSSFDPAIHLHSEQGDDAALPPPTFSDDINGLTAILEESTARKNGQGIVIQHRAWRTVEAFRSEDENIAGL
jgi:hypothetical protein